jgi:hypothetical protein
MFAPSNMIEEMLSPFTESAFSGTRPALLWNRPASGYPQSLPIGGRRGEVSGDQQTITPGKQLFFP